MNETTVPMLIEQQQAIAPSPAALRVRAALLEQSIKVQAVTNAGEQSVAVDAQTKLASTLKLVESTRKELKEPVLARGKQIDDAAKSYRAQLEAEELRISRLIANFQQLEAARFRAAQQAENDRLTALERERAAALAKAKTHDEIDSITEDFNQRAAVEAMPIGAPARAEGQVVKEDWDITVNDLHALYRAYPYCVKLEALPGQIKALLDSGTLKIPGVIATRTVKAGVRAKQTAIIELEPITKSVSN